MTDEEKAVEIENAIYYYRPQTDRERKLIELLVEEKIEAYLDGLTEGRKEICKKILKELEVKLPYYISNCLFNDITKIIKDLGVEV